MAQWRDFNASNEPDTCLWCGKKLRRRMTSDFSHENFEARTRGEKVETYPMYDKAGDYGDGHFCGLRCGYMFGVRFADLGRRLNK